MACTYSPNPCLPSVAIPNLRNVLPKARIGLQEILGGSLTSANLLIQLRARKNVFLHQLA